MFLTMVRHNFGFICRNYWVVIFSTLRGDHIALCKVQSNSLLTSTWITLVNIYWVPNLLYYSLNRSIIKNFRFFSNFNSFSHLGSGTTRSNISLPYETWKWSINVDFNFARARERNVTKSVSSEGPHIGKDWK